MYPLVNFLFQPFLHNWCNMCFGMSLCEIECIYMMLKYFPFCTSIMFIVDE